MKCMQCGYVVPEDSDFCPYCGSKIVHSLHNEEANRDAYASYDDSEKKSTKTTMWLVAALIAAVAIIAILCIAIFTRSDNKDKFKESSTSEAIENNTDEQLVPPAVNGSSTEILEEKADNLLATAADSVLYLEIYDKQDECIGTATGFLVDNNTTLVTNYHVVQDAYSIGTWTQDNQFVEANTLLAYDEVSDLAVLRCDATVEKEPLILANSDEVKQTMSVYAIGYPLGLANTVSNGIISARYIDEYGNDTLQTTAAVSTGNSGGPLLNENGEVIGVICAYYVDGQNLNIAIAANTLKEMLEEGFKPIDLTDWDDRPSMPTDCQHEYGEWIIDQAPTCTEGGQESCVCNLCGEVQINEMPPAGHTETVDPARNPTCSESGLTEGSHCSVCGEVFVEQTSISKTDHVFSNGKCSVCGIKDPNYVPTLSKGELLGKWLAWFEKAGVNLGPLGYESLIFDENNTYHLEYVPAEEETTIISQEGYYEIDGMTIVFFPSVTKINGDDYDNGVTIFEREVAEISSDEMKITGRFVYSKQW